MKNILVRKGFLQCLTLLAVIAAGGTLRTVLAQGSGGRAIDRAQRAVRLRIISQEAGRDRQEGTRNLTVVFNGDAQSAFSSNSQVRVTGTGTFSRNNDSPYNKARDNDRRYDDSRNDRGRSRDFSYEALVSNRYSTVSGIRYDWRAGWSGDNRGNNGRGNNGRDNNGRDNNGRDNNGRDNVAGSRPNGRATYSGPIMNRHSNKALDVTERSNQDGANIQQWSYADQPNQNWEVIDLGNGESAIISRQSGRALTVQGGRDNNGANIIQQGWRGSPQQRWRLERIGADYYRIVNVDNGKCLDVTQQGKQDGANIQLWDYVNQANQQWRLRR